MNTDVEVVEATHSNGRVLGEDVQRLFDEGSAHLSAGRNDDALRCLRAAHGLAPDHARLRSMLGVAIARVERDFEQSRTLCESAAKQEFFNPDLYLNLSSVYLEFGRRSEALRYLRRGQMIDPGHQPIRSAIGALGKRRLPIVPFLPRRHPLNRALGTARNIVMNGFSIR